MSQAELAAAIERERSTVTGYETGGIEPPLSVLRRIGEVTSTSLIELLGLELSHADLLRVLARANGQDFDANPGGNDMVQGIVVGLLVRPEPNEDA